MNDQRDSRSPRDRLLGMARAAREWPLAEQRRTATALMRMALGWEENGGMKPTRPERVALTEPNPFAKVADLRAPQAPACTESEIFEAVYGEPTGTKHWNALLGARDISDDNVAEALARHLTIEKLCEETERKSLRNTGLSILDLTKQECAHALDKIPPGALRGRVLQLFEDPNTRHLIPSSLRAVLVPSPEPAKSTPKHAGGRPRQYDHGMVEAEVSRLMDHHGEFAVVDKQWNSQARLEDALKQFCEKNFGEEPARSTLAAPIASGLAKWRDKKSNNRR